MKTSKRYKYRQPARDEHKVGKEGDIDESLKTLGNITCATSFIDPLGRIDKKRFNSPPPGPLDPKHSKSTLAYY